MSRPAALLLDLDGTTVATEPLHEEAHRRWLQRQGLCLEPGRMRRNIGRGDTSFYREILAEAGIEADPAAWAAGKNEILLDLYSIPPEKCTWSCAPSWRNGMGEPEGAPAPSMRAPSSAAPANHGDLWLRPGPRYDSQAVPRGRGLDDLLARCRRQGVPVVVVTASRRLHAVAALRAAGLDRTLPMRVCSDDVAHNKPAPDPYLRAAEVLGVPAGRCLAVEDSPTGAASAVAAGCRVYGFAELVAGDDLLAVGVAATVQDLSEVVW